MPILVQTAGRAHTLIYIAYFVCEEIG